MYEAKINWTERKNKLMHGYIFHNPPPPPTTECLAISSPHGKVPIQHMPSWPMLELRPAKELWACIQAWCQDVHIILHAPGAWALRVCVSHSVMSDSLQPYGLWPARLLCLWDSPGKNTGVGCHAFLQGIFPTQGLNPCLFLTQGSN